MVDKRIQTEVLLELMLSVGAETNEALILKKCLSLYLRKLNCFSASVLKNSGKGLQEFFHIPIAAKNANDWHDVKTHFVHVNPIIEKGFNEYGTKDGFYYGFKLSDYGYLILGRKKAFDKSLLYDLDAVIAHLGKVLVQANDIEHRQKAEQALRETEHRLQLSLEVNKASVMEFNLQTGQIISTPDLFLHLGYTEDEIPKDLSAVSNYVFEEDISVLHKAIDDHASGKTAEYYCEYRMYAKSGDLVWVDGQGKITVRNENNEPAILLGFSRDISKRKKAEEALILAKEKAEESDRLKSSFLANMSHEIRTPMNGILGFAELLKQPMVSGDEQKEYIRIIERSGIRLLNIINDLIDISKVESGQMKLFAQDTQINRQVRYIYDFFKLETEQKGLEFICKLPEPELEITINTDREKLYAILTNLVKNAIKYTDKGSIEIGYFENEADLVFYVKDTGIGISKGNQATVFNRFIQADVANPRAYGGAGLGLSITKAYIEMMGGKIWLESIPNRGSTFYVSLPIISIVNK